MATPPVIYINVSVQSQGRHFASSRSAATLHPDLQHRKVRLVLCSRTFGGPCSIPSAELLLVRAEADQLHSALEWCCLYYKAICSFCAHCRSPCIRGVQGCIWSIFLFNHVERNHASAREGLLLMCFATCQQCAAVVLNEGILMRRIRFVTWL